jgi:leucyl aminopeptidase
MSPSFAANNTPAVPIFLIEKQDLAQSVAALDERDRAWVAANGFSGALGEILLLPSSEGGVAGALIGWGDAAARRARPFALAGVLGRLPKATYRLETSLPEDEAEESALGWLLESYRFDRSSAATDRGERRLVAPAGVDAARVVDIAKAAWMARDLVNAPTSELGPAALAAKAQEMAGEFGAECHLFEGDALIDKRFPLIHAVGRAGAEAPRLIDIRWGKRGAPKVAIIGKGVCFDTGGLDLKPAAAMRLMKKDMGGAAAALGLARMIMSRRLPIRLRLLIPAVENAVSSASFRPGDVLTSRSGLTVEIGNTDAEGRLVLADAMTFAGERAPDLMIDFATLTGAARVALGPDLPALFTPSDALAGALCEAGADVRDPLWRLPLWQGYEEDVKSPIADLDNAPAGGMAGAITAALFLQRFAGGAAEWAHVDLYAWNPKARPGRPKGGEMQAARAVFRMLEKRYGRTG